MVSCVQPTKQPTKNSNTYKKKIIFDTDSAFFNDDGAALVMLLQSHRFDILGVTITAGNHWIPQGSVYMLYLLEVMKSGDIPVYLGETSPIKLKQNKINQLKSIRLLPGQKRKAFLSWTGALSRKENQTLQPPFGGKYATIQPKSENAVDFIIESVRANPGNITIVALGPMTNIAEAIKKAPDIENKIESLVFMGGAVEVPGNTTPYAEFNFWFDAPAANEVIQSMISNKIMFALDITNQAVLTKVEFARVVKVKTPITDIYNEDIGNRWPGFNKTPDTTSFVWDALVSAYLVDGSFITSSQTYYLKVNSKYNKFMGQVQYSKSPRVGYNKVMVMKSMDKSLFFDLYTHLLTQPIAH
ncbi:MAG: nucleoside hydrolase [Bdellovibrionales bacterium]|nr:nucleoside hydrolase [Bdellovibrionales bacterium]